MQSNEILAVVDSVSTEKGLEKDVIFTAIEIAIASASQRHFHEDADLFVKEIRVDGGSMLKRLRPAPQGRAHRIRKRSNHVTVVLGAKNNTQSN